MKTFFIDPEIPNREIMDQLAELLNAGKILAHPTETVYGLAANIYNDEAVDRIYDIKGRRTTKPLSIMVDSIETIETIVGGIRPSSIELMEKLLPGAVTVVLPIHKKNKSILFQNRKTIGVRIPNHKFCLELLKQVDFPLTTTSANKSGMKSSVLGVEVVTHFGNEIDALVDAGKTANGESSTVIDLSGEHVQILREGAVPSETILSLI